MNSFVLAQLHAVGSGAASSFLPPLASPAGGAPAFAFGAGAFAGALGAIALHAARSCGKREPGRET